MKKVCLLARPASSFVQIAVQFRAQISVHCGEKTANAKSIVGVLKLGSALGDTIGVCAEGEDTEQAVQT